MGFYAVLNMVNQLLVQRQWKLHRCRRQNDDSLHYYVTDTSNRVLTPTTTEHHFITGAHGEELVPATTHRRTGLTLMELLTWMEHSGDDELSFCARSFRWQVEDAC